MSPKPPRAAGRKLSEIIELPEANSRRASRHSARSQSSDVELNGERVIQQSDKVREAQVAYDRLIEAKQVCERKEAQLQINLAAAAKRQQSFNAYTNRYDDACSVFARRPRLNICA